MLSWSSGKRGSHQGVDGTGLAPVVGHEVNEVLSEASVKDIEGVPAEREVHARGHGLYERIDPGGATRAEDARRQSLPEQAEPSAERRAPSAPTRSGSRCVAGRTTQQREGDGWRKRPGQHLVHQGQHRPPHERGDEQSRIASRSGSKHHKAHTIKHSEVVEVAYDVNEEHQGRRGQEDQQGEGQAEVAATSGQHTPHQPPGRSDDQNEQRNREHRQSVVVLSPTAAMEAVQHLAHQTTAHEPLAVVEGQLGRHPGARHSQPLQQGDGGHQHQRRRHLRRLEIGTGPHRKITLVGSSERALHEIEDRSRQEPRSWDGQREGAGGPGRTEQLAATIPSPVSGRSGPGAESEVRPERDQAGVVAGNLGDLRVEPARGGRRSDDGST